MKVKATLFNFHAVMKAHTLKKSLTIPSVGQNVGKWNLFFIIGGRVKWSERLGK